MDTWRAQHIGPRPYVHAVGFNAAEGNRIAGDISVTLGGQRRPLYPVHDIGWTRQDCLDYLREQFGVTWAKLACRQCCFCGGRSGWPEQLARFIASPAEAAPHLVDEFVAVALNHRSALFGPRGWTLRARLERDGALEVVALADQALADARWALYRVRRCYTAPGVAWRSVEQVHHGDRAAPHDLQARLADRLGPAARLHHDAGHTRLWLTEPPGPPSPVGRSYPHVEEFYAAAPAQVHNKARSGFASRWAACAGDELLAREQLAAAALTALTGRAHRIPLVPRSLFTTGAPDAGSRPAL